MASAFWLKQTSREENALIAFARRLLCPNQGRWTTTEWEAYAVVWALDTFRAYVEGSLTLVGTDHSPLPWIRNTVGKSAKIARWVLALQDFAFDLKYRAGKCHNVPDALARNAAGEPGAGEDLTFYARASERTGVCATATQPTPLLEMSLEQHASRAGGGEVTDSQGRHSQSEISLNDTRAEQPRDHHSKASATIGHLKSQIPQGKLPIGWPGDILALDIFGPFPTARKLAPRYSGPWTVTRVLDKGATYCFQDPVTYEGRQVPHERLKDLGLHRASADPAGGTLPRWIAPNERQPNNFSSTHVEYPSHAMSPEETLRVTEPQEHEQSCRQAPTLPDEVTGFGAEPLREGLRWTLSRSARAAPREIFVRARLLEQEMEDMVKRIGLIMMWGMQRMATRSHR
ncbi:hypothetical protein Efla_003967 [Eimeria flavescens]